MDVSAFGPAVLCCSDQERSYCSTVVVAPRDREDARYAVLEHEASVLDDACELFWVVSFVVLYKKTDK